MTDVGTITPALMPQEWTGCAVERGDELAYLQTGNELVIRNKDDSGTWDYGTAGPAMLHAVAALCLVGQPFGFTRDDVGALNEAINEFRVKGIAPIDPHSAEFRETAEALQSIADRIAALLPPRQ